MKTTTKNVLAVPVISRSYGSDRGKVIAVSPRPLCLHNTGRTPFGVEDPQPDPVRVNFEHDFPEQNGKLHVRCLFVMCAPC